MGRVKKTVAETAGKVSARAKKVFRLAFPIAEFSVALLFELFLLVLFTVEGLHLMLGAFNNYEDRLAGFFLHLFRVLSVLLGMIFAEEAMRHALTKERHHQFLTIIYFLYLAFLSVIFAFICPELFGLSYPELLVIGVVLAILGFITAFSQYFYIKADPDSVKDETLDEEDDEDFVDEEDIL